VQAACCHLFRRWKAKQNGLLWKKCLGISAGVNMVLVSVLCFVAISWAQRLLSALDEEANPCDDFYQFACGNWMHQHIPDGTQAQISQFTQATKMIRKDIQDILETKVELEDPLPVRQMRELYKECTATGSVTQCVR